MSEHKERVGSRIREARNAKGWSQADLARALLSGDASQVSRWERGKVLPSTATLEEIAKTLDRDYSYFIAPKPKDGTGDLMGALGANGHQPGAPTQLDGVQAVQQAILDRLEALAEEVASLRKELRGRQAV